MIYLFFSPIIIAKIAGAWVEIKKGNLTNESVRGIVNTTNNEMNLMRGVYNSWSHIVYSAC